MTPLISRLRGVPSSQPARRPRHEMIATNGATIHACPRVSPEAARREGSQRFHRSAERGHYLRDVPEGHGICTGPHGRSRKSHAPQRGSGRRLATGRSYVTETRQDLGSPPRRRRPVDHRRAAPARRRSRRPLTSPRSGAPRGGHDATDAGEEASRHPLQEAGVPVAGRSRSSRCRRPPARRRRSRATTVKVDEAPAPANEGRAGRSPPRQTPATAGEAAGVEAAPATADGATGRQPRTARRAKKPRQGRREEGRTAPPA